MWELGHKEGWAPKNWCFQTVVLEKTLESPLDSKIKPVNPKGNQSWIFIGRTNAQAEAPILWSRDVKSQLIGKDPDARKDWEQEEKGATEDEMVVWHHRLNGHEFGANSGRWWRAGWWSPWCAAVHGVTKNRTRLRDWTTTKYGMGYTYAKNHLLVLWNSNLTGHPVFPFAKSSNFIAESPAKDRKGWQRSNVPAGLGLLGRWAQPAVRQQDGYQLRPRNIWPWKVAEGMGWPPTPGLLRDSQGMFRKGGSGSAGQITLEKVDTLISSPGTLSL